MTLTTACYSHGSTWSHIMQDDIPCERHKWWTLNFNSRSPRDDSIECCSVCGQLRTTHPLMSYG